MNLIEVILIQLLLFIRKDEEMELVMVPLKIGHFLNATKVVQFLWQWIN